MSKKFLTKVHPWKKIIQDEEGCEEQSQSGIPREIFYCYIILLKKVVKLALENPKTQVKNTGTEMRRPGEKQEAQPYSRSQKYQDRDNYDVPV